MFVVVYTETLACVVRGLQTQRTNPGNLSSLAGTTDGSLAHAKYDVGIREQSPDSRSSLAILPMYDPEVADLVGRRRYGSVHCRGGGRLESTTGPLHMWPSPATSSEILGSNPRPSDERPRYSLLARQAGSYLRPIRNPRRDSNLRAQGFWRAKAVVLPTKLNYLGLTA